jgi:HK97 family phage major capsid protein
MKKKLMEKRADLLNKMQALNEKEGFSSDDQTTYDQYKNEVVDIDKQLSNIAAVDALRANQAANQVTDSETKEIQKNWNFVEAMRQAKNKSLDGFVLEMHQEGEKEARSSGISLIGAEGSLLIPTAIQTAKIFQNNAVVVGTPSAGGYAVATELRSFVDYLWDAMVLTGLGADYIPGLVGDIDFPKESTVPAMTWGTETGEADQSSPTFGINKMKPKRGSTYMDVSNQVLIQTAGAMQARLARQLINAVSIGIERAGISGSGTNDEPLGILATAGIGDVAGATDGSALTWADVVDLETKVSVENANLGTLGYLTNAKVRGKMKTTSKVSGQNGFIWDNDGTVNGYRVGATNLVPSNLTKGSSSGVLSAMIFGNFNDLLIGQWGPIEIMANPYTKAKSGMTEMIVNAYVDVLVQRAKSFAAKKDIITT